MRHPALLLCLALAACAHPAPGPSPAPRVDDVAAARQALARERAALRGPGPASAARAARMVRLGLWTDAERLVGPAPTDPGLRLELARLRFLQHRYPEADSLVAALLRRDPADPGARLLRARLQLQAWELPAATATLQALLRERRRDAGAALLLGRIRLLEKRYDEAADWAERVRGWDRRNAGAYLLEADVRFWQDDAAGAEAPLRRALALDPFDADARFAYGYALWRRVDATRLGDMADEWDLALELDPLHFATHWHFGNGHTDRTYADYVQPEDSVVRARLAPADSLISAGQIPAALALAREVGREFPQSLLPAMLRGSAFYMAWGMDAGERLDSAQAIFLSVLARKRHYGPAHNGVAAVIKQRQFRALARYDSLEAVIAATPLPPMPVLDSVFPDLRGYPGDRVRREVVEELGPAIAYLPLIWRQHRRYRIPPLHHDLAEVMGSPYFRTATTFDNRQWMDIRGVGSGAAAIEYVERGAHQERNVLLHEYVHLVHQAALTDAETRRVRALYYQAMREGRALDYYAANNEHEFLAQAYPAFLSPVKVHPLNHKAMNTREDLRRKDPATFAFVDSLVARDRAFLAGDRSVFASNWAQVYVNLADEARREAGVEALQRGRRAAALLDTALIHDARYLPALLGYAALERERGSFAEAARWLSSAQAIDDDYAPIYAERARLAEARGRAGELSEADALGDAAALYQRALALEGDLQERAELSGALRRLYAAHARLPEAVRSARAYAEDAPALSTYLRDQRSEAVAFAEALRAEAGYAAETLDFFRDLVAQRPQDWPLRARFADALLRAGRADEAAATLEQAERILAAGGSPSGPLLLRLAEARLLQGDSTAALAALGPVLDGRAAVEEDAPRLALALLQLGQSSEAHRRLAAFSGDGTPRTRARLAYVHGWIGEWRGDAEEAERLYRAALADDPYQLDARVRLVRLLRERQRPEEARRLVEEAAALPLPLGPDFRRDVQGGSDDARTR